MAGQTSVKSDFHGTITGYRSLPHGAEDHGIFAIIGKAVAEWARHEHELDELIFALAGNDPAVLACVTAQINGPAARWRAIEALAVQRAIPGPLIERVRKLRGDRSYEGGFRNRLVHDPWFAEVGTSAPAQFRKGSPKRRTFGIEGFDPAEAERSTAEIRALTERIGTLRADVRRALDRDPVP